jgi:2-oxoglutarate dehydrogenase complex dehydrogenase (E1) component-like enzyme
MVVAYAGRPVAATTAVGYMSMHIERQKKLIEDAFAPQLSAGEMLFRT